MRERALAYSVTLADDPRYDCSFCQRQFDEAFRRRPGCPFLHAEGEVTHTALSDDRYSTTSCPGAAACSAFVSAIWRLHESAESGYSLGDLDSAPAPETDALIILRRLMRRREHLLKREDSA
jgi:hypothetical protein